MSILDEDYKPTSEVLTIDQADENQLQDLTESVLFNKDNYELFLNLAKRSVDDVAEIQCRGHLLRLTYILQQPLTHFEKLKEVTNYIEIARMDLTSLFEKQKT